MFHVTSIRHVTFCFACDVDKKLKDILVARVFAQAMITLGRGAPSWGLFF